MRLFYLRNDLLHLGAIEGVEVIGTEDIDLAINEHFRGAIRRGGNGIEGRCLLFGSGIGNDLNGLDIRAGRDGILHAGSDVQ